MSISVRATGEAKLITALTEVEAIWKQVPLICIPYKNDESMTILSEIDELYNFLDENLAQVNMILGNRYAAVVRTKAEKTKAELQKLDACIEEWTTLQKNWMYLENIFKAPEIRRVLQLESDMFMNVDKFFKAHQARAVKAARARHMITTAPKMLEDLKKQNADLDHIQKKLQ